jgi:hypothetical protein
MDFEIVVPNRYDPGYFFFRIKALLCDLGMEDIITTYNQAYWGSRQMASVRTDFWSCNSSMLFLNLFGLCFRS